MEVNAFKEKLDAAKFAMSVAIKSDVIPSQAEKAGTIWNVGSFDPQGELRQLIGVFYPECETPYRAIEHLIDAGLKIIDQQRDGGNLDVLRLFEM